MSELLANLALGFGVAFSPMNLLFCMIGALVGTLIGVLPGIGSVATIAMLLPITFGLPPVGALIMLAGIYYGAQYGGSTTSILVNIPGEATSVVTAIDGHQMARQGRAGAALSIAAIGSFFAGCVTTVLVAALGAPLTSVALLFGPAEYFSLMVLGLIFAVVLAKGSVLKALAMIMHRSIAVASRLRPRDRRRPHDVRIAGTRRRHRFRQYRAGCVRIRGDRAQSRTAAGGREILMQKVTDLMPTRKDLIDSAAPDRAWDRGGRAHRHPSRCRRGDRVVCRLFGREEDSPAIPRVSATAQSKAWRAPRAANNAAAQAAFIPLLTLGIPPNAVMALMVGAMTIHGIVPGPQVMTKQPELFWGMIASMWIGNLALVVINLPLVGLWVALLRVPYRLLFPSIVVFCCIGVYSINNSPSDVLIAAMFGVIGYWFAKHDFEPAPMLLGFVLGPLMEENLRRAMLIARGDATVFFTRPISAALLGTAIVMLILSGLPMSAKAQGSAGRVGDLDDRACLLVKLSAAARYGSAVRSVNRRTFQGGALCAGPLRQLRRCCGHCRRAFPAFAQDYPPGRSRLWFHSPPAVQPTSSRASSAST